MAYLLARRHLDDYLLRGGPQGLTDADRWEATMAAGRVHTLYRRDRWLVEREDAAGLSFFDDKATAMYVGQTLADKLGTAHVIHARSGVIVAELPAEAVEPHSARASSAIPSG